MQLQYKICLHCLPIAYIQATTWVPNVQKHDYATLKFS